MPQFAVRVVSPTRAAEELIKNQVLRNHSANEIEQALKQGLDYLTSRGVRISSEMASAIQSVICC
jgi:hypothetical protein